MLLPVIHLYFTTYRVHQYIWSISVMFTLMAFCTYVARKPGRAGAAPSCTAYKKPKVQKVPGITEDDHL